MVMGISAVAMGDPAGPTIAMTLGSATNALVLCAPRFGECASGPIVSAFERNPRACDTTCCVRLVDSQSKGGPRGGAAINGA